MSRQVCQGLVHLSDPTATNQQTSIAAPYHLVRCPKSNTIFQVEELVAIEFTVGCFIPWIIAWEQRTKHQDGENYGYN